MSQPTDIRRGRPSCSALHRLQNCPASFWLSQGMPDESTPDSESGERVHEWLALPSKKAWEAMSIDEQDTAQRCDKQADELEEAWLVTKGARPEDCTHAIKEERIGMTKSGVTHFVRPDDGRDYDITGQADYIEIIKVEGKTHALIIDYKTGRGEVEDARDNAQLRGLAVLVAHHFGCDTVMVSIVQPWAGPPSSAHYDAEALSHALEWLDHVLDAIDAHEVTPDPPRAGDWCKYCPARNRPCPALVTVGTAPLRETLLRRPLPEGKEKEALFARAMELTTGEVAVLLDKLSMYDRAAAAIRGAARSILESGGQVPGWELRSTKPKQTVSDIGLVWERLSQRGVSAADFTAACSITKKALKPLVKAAPGEPAYKALAAVLDGAVSHGKPTVKLVRVGEQLEDEE